ncbi:MAG: hypothetical protein ACI4P1_03530 [Erysipelotrichaceae bacterium]|nr:hypothetical protein [Bacillota bacterium]MDY3092142.1 hypothetical protein [Erysipelotrichaceae bacterium]
MKRKELKDIKPEDLDGEMSYLVSVDGTDKYVMMPREMYEEMMEHEFMKPTGVRLIADGDFKLTPEEYLELKEQLIEQLDKFLGPRIEKLS